MSDSFKDSTILVADDEPYICELFRDLFEPTGATVHTFYSGQDALKAIEQEEPDIAIFDVRMPAPDGLELLSTLRAKGATFPILIVTAQESSTVTIEAMQRGAYDYLAKPFEPDEILATVERALEYRRLTRRVQKLEKQIAGRDPRDIMIGRSPAMQRVYKLIGRVANSEATVLITGESGTGKEVVANVLHQNSMRREGPFVAVNCAALPETLLESELFGHEKGAFTGAVAQRKGRFEQAKGGTIFLDEIGEISPATQKKLLRVLQEKSFERVGGNVAIKADVRVLAATNRNLLAEVAAGNFREDLYYRLNVINVELPPLRERADDIPLLVQFFLTRAGKRANGRPPQITEAAMEALTTYRWPGNVRQLENTIERAVVLSQGQLIEPGHLYLFGEEGAQSNDPLDEGIRTLLVRGESLETMMHRLRHRLITLAVRYHNNSPEAAARALGVAIDSLERES
jgi:DNA-binding NtrC family response regulator